MSRRQVGQDVSHVLPGCTDAERKALADVPGVYKKIKRMKRRSGAVVNQPLRIRILNSSLPTDVQVRLCKEIAAEGSDSNYTQYAEGVLKLPRVARPVAAGEDPTDYLLRARATLEATVHGQDALKERLLEIVARTTCDTGGAPLVLGIQGPPGNGKTTLLRRGLAKALDLPFHTVALGGMSDAGHLLGFERTYHNARHGRLADIAMNSGCTNPIIFFDELDKIAESSSGTEIVNVLIHLTDPEGRDTIHDKFLGEINLAGATLVFAFNDETRVHPVLLNRLQVVHTTGYNDEQKLEIAKQHLVPRATKCLARGELAIGDDTLTALIQRAGSGGGVRKLVHAIEGIAQRANTCITTGGIVTLGIPSDCYCSATQTVQLQMPMATPLLDLVAPGEKSSSPPAHMYL